MTPFSPQKLDYSHEKFVDREEALELVLDKARRIAQGEREERRVILFHGQRGSGKTWLLHEIEALKPEGVSCCRHRLPAGISIETIRQEAASQPRPLIVLLDVDGAQGPELDELASRVLAPLVREEKILIVLAERGRGHYWLIPEFRDKSEEYDLEPFKREDMEEQVARQVPKTAASLDHIEALGGGYPWSTYVLAMHLPDSVVALDLCIEMFLTRANKHLREPFTALSVLRAFDEERMVPLLRAFSKKFRDQEWTYRKCQDMLQGLLETTLANWNSERRGYVIDEPLRRALEARLLVQDPELWRKLHDEARALYGQWVQVQDHPYASEWWMQEMAYHEERLNKGALARPASPLVATR